MLKCDLMKNGKCSCTTKCAKLIWYEQGRADAIEEVKRLIDERESGICNMGSCDDCIMCCEVRALDWLLEQLKEQK